MNSETDPEINSSYVFCRSLLGPLAFGLFWLAVVGTVIAVDGVSDLWRYLFFLLIFVLVPDFLTTFNSLSSLKMKFFHFNNILSPLPE